MNMFATQSIAPLHRDGALLEGTVPNNKGRVAVFELAQQTFRAQIVSGVWHPKIN
jgi:hypothetical protein